VAIMGDLVLFQVLETKCGQTTGTDMVIRASTENCALKIVAQHFGGIIHGSLPIHPFVLTDNIALSVRRMRILK